MYFARCDPKSKPQLTSTVAGSVVGPTLVVKCESLLLNRGEGFILARAFFELPQLMLRYLFHHSMWRCYLASCFHSFAKRAPAPTLPDVSGLSPRFGTMIKSFLQECSRNKRLGIQAPLNAILQGPCGFPCLIAQLRTGYCTHCVFRRDVWLTYSGGELRMRRIDMRIFDTRPAAIFGERSSN